MKKMNEKNAMASPRVTRTTKRPNETPPPPNPTHQPTNHRRVLPGISFIFRVMDGPTWATWRHWPKDHRLLPGWGPGRIFFFGLFFIFFPQLRTRIGPTHFLHWNKPTNQKRKKNKTKTIQHSEIGRAALIVPTRYDRSFRKMCPSLPFFAFFFIDRRIEKTKKNTCAVAVVQPTNFLGPFVVTLSRWKPRLFVETKKK